MGIGFAAAVMLRQLALAAVCLQVAAAGCPHHCSGHGTCNRNDLCECAPGWGSHDCSLPTCINDCSGKGTCLQGHCFCQNGFTVEDCGTATCTVDCYNHGSCVEGVCKCDDNGPGDSWRGAQCNRPNASKTVVATESAM